MDVSQRNRHAVVARYSRSLKLMGCRALHSTASSATAGNDIDAFISKLLSGIIYFTNHGLSIFRTPEVEKLGFFSILLLRVCEASSKHFRTSQLKHA